jgi:hypothetical protein
MQKISRSGWWLVGVLAVAAVSVVWMGHRSRGHNALAAYKAELRRKGERLTLAELTQGRSTNANHSQAVLTNAVAQLRSARFGNGFDLRKYVAPGRARVVWRDATPAWNAPLARPAEWTWEGFAADVRGLETPLAQLREALRDPAADAGPPTPFLVGRRVNFVALRSAAQWLGAVTMSDLHAGDLEGAVRDLETEAALARLNREEYTLVAQMIRMAIANHGLAATWEALPAPGWSEPQLARLQRAWEAVDLLAALQMGLEGERGCLAGVWDGLRGPNRSKAWQEIMPGSTRYSFAGVSLERLLQVAVLVPAYKLTSMNQDELFYLQTMQGWIDGGRLLQAHRPWLEAKTQFDAVSSNINRVLSSPVRMRHWVSAMAIPNLTRATQVAARAETERQMTVAAIALERCRLRRGQWPAALPELVPDFVSRVPFDPMSGQPLQYRLRTEGGYLLYSVGDDGRDDGGDPSPVAPGKPGLWEGRDAVWPSAAAAEGRQSSAP